MGKHWFVVIALSACTSADEETGPAALRFPTDGSIEAAWGMARLDPAGGVPTVFPVTAFGIADGTEVQLLAGRSSTSGYPLTTGDDVIIADAHDLARATVIDGHAEFAPLGVAMENWTAGSDTVPAYLLCGATVIAARAYEGDDRAKRMLAATWLVAVSADCE